jgi:hypothetical protein
VGEGDLSTEDDSRASYVVWSLLHGLVRYDIKIAFAGLIAHRLKMLMVKNQLLLFRSSCWQRYLKTLLVVYDGKLGFLRLG